MKAAMLIDKIERDFRDKVADEVCLIAERTGRYLIFTPFCFSDGDHLAIVLKQDGSRWVLSDEAHTYMRLSFDMDEQAFLSGPRQKIIADALSEIQVEDCNGELLLDLSEGRYGHALASFIQALLAIIENGRPEEFESPAPHSFSLSPQE